MERKRVVEKSEYISLLDMLDGKSLEEAQTYINGLYSKYEREMIAEDKLVKIEYNRGYYDEPGDWYVVVYRWETDEELAKREAKALKAKEKAKQKALAKKEAAQLKKKSQLDVEFQLYQELKKKFEK